MAADAQTLHKPMATSGLPPEWSWQRLDVVCDVFDCPHSTPVLTEEGPLIARSQDIRSGVFRWAGAGRVSEETYRERTARAQPQHGDLLYSREGTYFGIAAEVPSAIRVCLGQRMVLVRPKVSVVDSRFLRYWLNSPVMVVHILGQRDGSVAERLNLPTIRALPVVLPPLPEQRAIAYILGTLDDKTELNRRMNETLEAMARALFQWWLMDISPTRAKAADLIRDGVLEIGDGYRAKNSELGEPGLPFIRAANLNNGFDTDAADRLRQDRVVRAGKKIARRGDVAFTSKGTIGRFAWVAADDKFVYSPQVCYWRSLDHDRLHPTILYCWMQTGDLMGQIDAVAGQTDMAPYVSLQDQRAMSIPVFPPSQHAIVRKLDPLLARQSANVVESRILAELRDTLLPKLVSGQIRIKDAERIAGGVA